MAVTFGMVRYVYGLTLPGIRAGFVLSDLVLGLIAGGTFTGFLLALLLSTRLSAKLGPRAPTTLGGLCATVGCAVVALAPAPSVLAAGALVAGGAAGWVWAPYSEIATRVVPEADRPRVLAQVTTGAAVGLIVVGPLALAAATWASWRWTWAAIAGLAAAATVLNIRWVPRLAPAQGTPGPRASFDPRMTAPLGFAAVLFAGATAYFTYATDSAERGGLGAVAGPVVFALVGTTGLAGLWTGTFVRRIRPAPVAAVSLLVLGVALAMLGLGSRSLPVVLASAVAFGAANTIGSAALPIWTAQLVPDRPAGAFSAVLVVGSVSAIGTPAVIGGVVTHLGLVLPLVATAIVCAASALVMTAVQGR